MAIIKCPECGKNVSDTACICPYCGYNPAVARRRKLNSVAKIFVIALIIIVLGSIVVATILSRIF